MNPIYIRIRTALLALGENVEKHKFTARTSKSMPDIYHVYKDDVYYGIWDDRKKTFVD